MTTHWKAIVGVILVFVFGFISGIVCSSIVVQHRIRAFLQHPAVAVVDALEKRLTGNLNLNADQKQKVHEYFMENLQHRKELQAQIRPQIELLNTETAQQINAVLKPEQQQTFNQNVDTLRKRFAQVPFGNDGGNTPPATNSATGTPPPGH